MVDQTTEDVHVALDANSYDQAQVRYSDRAMKLMQLLYIGNKSGVG